MAEDPIMNLVRKYGTIARIPTDELDRLGYMKVGETRIIKRVDDVDEYLAHGIKGDSWKRIKDWATFFKEFPVFYFDNISDGGEKEEASEYQISQKDIDLVSGFDFSLQRAENLSHFFGLLAGDLINTDSMDAKHLEMIIDGFNDHELGIKSGSEIPDFLINTDIAFLYLSGVRHSVCEALYKKRKKVDINDKQAIRKVAYQIFAEKLGVADEQIPELERKLKERLFALESHITPDSDFSRLVRASLDSHLDDYVNSLPENQKMGAELEFRGVNVTNWTQCTVEREYALSASGLSDPSKVRETLVREAVSAIDQLVNLETIVDPTLFMDKIRDKFFKGKRLIYETDKEIFLARLRDYMLESDDNTKAVVTHAKIYCSDTKNLKVKKESIQNHLFHLNKVQDYFKGAALREKGVDKEYQLRIRLARKDPFTITDIGNDSGCCIGVYEDDSNWGGATNGRFMPFYEKDLATQFLEIYLGKDRSGLALMFAGYDNEGKATLIVNSIELGKRFDSNRELVLPTVEACIDYLKDFAMESGFKRLVIGSHDYNTAVDYCKDREMDTISEEFFKIDKFKDPFYSDVFEWKNEVDSVLRTNKKFYELKL